MIKHNAIVAKVDNHRVWIENRQKTACGSCLQKDACSTSLLEKWLPKRMVAVDSEIPLKTGDEVVVAINESQLIWATLLLYLVPLLFLFLGAGLSTWLLPSGVHHADLWVAVAAFGSFFVSLGAIHKLQYLLLNSYRVRPQVQEKLNKSEKSCFSSAQDCSILPE